MMMYNQPRDGLLIALTGHEVKRYVPLGLLLI
jgi:hypothetical protein